MASSPVSRLPLRPRHLVHPSSSEGILVKLKANQGTALSYSEPFRGSPLPQKHVHLHPVSDKVLLVLLVLCPPLQLLMLLMPGVLSPLPQLQPPGFLLLQQRTVLRAFAHVAHFQAPPSSPHPAIPSSQPHPTESSALVSSKSFFVSSSHSFHQHLSRYKVKISTCLLIAAIFPITKSWKQPKCPSVHQRMNG